MKKIKKILGKVLVVALSCLAVGAVVNAEGSATTDVQIEIEGSEVVSGEDNQVITDDTKAPVEKLETVQTGDKMTKIPYLVAMAIAVAVGAVCVWKKKRKGMFAIFALFLSIFLVNQPVHAAETTENVSVTIPTSISILFDETGENSITEFEVKNQSLVPITIEKINATECNHWILAEKEQEIPVNTKKMVFEIEGKCLVAGENIVEIPITENTGKTLNIYVERGAWTNACAKETALQLEFEYEIGKKEFQLSFDANGYDTTIDTQNVYNGDSVELPTLERDGYVFAGWEDAEGNLHTNQYTMPIGDVTLKASWNEKIAYAIYSASDTSLRFVRSAEPIEAGDTYNGRVVTAVFTGFEEAVYASETQVPWYDGNQYESRILTKVVFEDEIKPISTAYWFCWASDCISMDMRKLNMSNVTNMCRMCGWAGSNVDNFTIIGMNDWDVSNVTNMNYAFRSLGFNTETLVLDLSKWDVSKVKDMNGAFRAAGYYATTFSLGDISKWNVSNVVDMGTMLMQTGFTAPWTLNLSKWNVSKVTNYDGFALAIESKITEPNWKY